MTVVTSALVKNKESNKIQKDITAITLLSSLFFACDPTQRCTRPPLAPECLSIHECYRFVQSLLPQEPAPILKMTIEYRTNAKPYNKHFWKNTPRRLGLERMP